MSNPQNLDCWIEGDEIVCANGERIPKYRWYPVTLADDHSTLLKDACRTAYQLAWNIEQATADTATRMRAAEIKRVTMAALQATNAEFQSRQVAPPGDGARRRAGK